MIYVIYNYKTKENKNMKKLKTIDTVKERNYTFKKEKRNNLNSINNNHNFTFNISYSNNKRSK